MMPSLRLTALSVIACSAAAFALACGSGGDDVAPVPDASGTDVTTEDTGTDDTGVPDTGTDPDAGTTDGGADAAPTGILCVPTNCTEGAEACCAPNGGTTDTCKAVPDGGNLKRTCAGNESEFRCSTSEMCGGGNSRCCVSRPKFVLGDAGATYTASCTTQGCANSPQSFRLTLCTPNGTIDCGDAGTCKPLLQQDGGPGIPAGYYACQ